MIERTGLTILMFDYDLEWTPTVEPAGVAPGALNDQAPTAGPNVFTALHEKLGELENRVEIFAALRLDLLDKLALRQRLDQIGQARLPEV